jgi:hypothetical protein
VGAQPEVIVASAEPRVEIVLRSGHRLVLFTAWTPSTIAELALAFEAAR